MTRWQPIDTAPFEEGKPVLLLLENGVPLVGSWVPADSEGNIYVVGWWDPWADLGPYGLPVVSKPTHWATLPEPPSD